MATYVVGDVQGCYRELMELLDRVGFNTKKDRLWLVGDLVSRGPDSDQVLKFLFKNQRCIKTVLGNHDLHLIAIYYGVKNAKASDRLTATLKAKGLHDWIDWLCTQPLCFHDKKRDYTVVHAGMAPQWTAARAVKYSAEVEEVLQSEDCGEFLEQMYGNAPKLWDASLKGDDRLRCVVNYFTRTRILARSGAMEFSFKGQLEDMPKNYYPWYKHPDRKTKNRKIIFGHWASIGGYVDHKNLFGLDTGCVWGRMMTMMNVDTQELCLAQSHTRSKF